MRTIDKMMAFLKKKPGPKGTEPEAYSIEGFRDEQLAKYTLEREALKLRIKVLEGDDSIIKKIKDMIAGLNKRLPGSSEFGDNCILAPDGNSCKTTDGRTLTYKPSGSQLQRYFQKNEAEGKGQLPIKETGAEGR